MLVPKITGGALSEKALDISSLPDSLAGKPWFRLQCSRPYGSMPDKK
jgi:hypothetical protein